MASDLAKQHAFVEKAYYGEVSNNKKLFTIDINKCRRNILLYSKYDYCIFTCFDKSEPFVDPKIVPGMYYIEFEDEIQCNTKYYLFNHKNEIFIDENKQYFKMDNHEKIYIELEQYPNVIIKKDNEDKRYFPLRGNGWVYHNMVLYCLDNNIITLDNIKYVIKSSLTLKHDYFNKFIEYVNDKVPKHSKLAINSMIGTFNRNLKKNETWKSLSFTPNSCDAFNSYIKNNGCFIEFKHIEGKKYYHTF